MKRVGKINVAKLLAQYFDTPQARRERAKSVKKDMKRIRALIKAVYDVDVLSQKEFQR